jgi:hypothetical protein
VAVRIAQQPHAHAGGHDPAIASDELLLVASDTPRGRTCDRMMLSSAAWQLDEVTSARVMPRSSACV